MKMEKIDRKRRCINCWKLILVQIIQIIDITPLQNQYAFTWNISVLTITNVCLFTFSFFSRNIIPILYFSIADRKERWNFIRVVALNFKT